MLKNLTGIIQLPIGNLIHIQLKNNVYYKTKHQNSEKYTNIKKIINLLTIY